MASYTDALRAYQQLPERVQSAMLATVNAKGVPNASYAPFVRDNQCSFYLFVSGLSPHTQNLAQTGKASLMLIEDEANASQIFARQRLSYDCSVSLVPRESDGWSAIADRFEARFGGLVQTLRGLGDFRIFQLSPYQGRFVMGFGAAYQVDPQDLSQLIHIDK
ncbi:MAG: pyridoxamine 5'-phosphate oxidase family protein [Cyanobacteria bacterium P01_H01_bin.119]